MKNDNSTTEQEAENVAPGVKNNGSKATKRRREKPLKIRGTLNDVLRAAVLEKPTVKE